MQNRITALLFFFFILIGIADATNPGHSLISITLPVLLALVSFVFGLYRFRVQSIDCIILIVLNVSFLVLTYNTKLFLINIFILSLLVWSLLVPFIVRFKATLASIILIAVFLSFLIPYYKLAFPLLPVLYFPFYIFGYMLESLKLKRNWLTTIYCTVGMLISAALLVNTLLRGFRIRSFYGKVYIQSVFSNNAAFVFAPIVVIGFILLVFSILLLSTGITDFGKLKNVNRISWRASFISGTVMLPFLYGVIALHPGRALRLSTFPVLVVLFLIIYGLLNMKLGRTGSASSTQSNGSSSVMDEISAAEETSVPQIDVDINRLLFRLLFSICFVLAMVGSIEYIIRSNDIAQVRLYTTTPSFAYNLIFVGVLYLLATSLLGMKPGTILMGFVHFVLSLANFLKLKFFSEPFFPWDIGLINDAIRISRDYVSIYALILAAIVLLAGIILIVKYFGKALRFLKPKPNIKLAAILIIPMAFNLHLLAAGSLKSIDVYKSWYDGVREYVRNGTYVENVLYLQHIKNYINSKPQGYSRKAVRQLEDKYGAVKATSDLKPDIIVILGETYWDPEVLSGVSFNKEIGANLKKYQSGTLISPAFGGGTANVEFEVLTGFSNFFFNTSIIPYNVYFKHDMPSVVSAFKDSGYNAVALHPNTGDFYNRDNVYKYMGFDEFKDIKSFDPSTETKGNYVSDDKLVDRIADTLKEKTGPAFVLGITMQNHDPYNGSIKNYGPDREIQVESDKLDDAEKDVLANFAQGVYDEDKALGKLIDIAKNNDRPTLIYMFGDHLPRLGVGLPQGNYEIYNKLGYSDGTIDPRSDMKFYETPYIAWSSYKELPKPGTPISPSQLGLQILTDAGIKYPSYFNCLLELRAKHPYLSSYIDSKELIDTDKSVQDYYMVQYDLMFGNEYFMK